MPGVQSRGATPWTSIVEGPDRYAHDAGVCHRCKDAPLMHYHVFQKKNWSPLPKKKQFLLDAKNATDILIPLPKMPAPDIAPRRLRLMMTMPPPMSQMKKISPIQTHTKCKFSFCFIWNIEKWCLPDVRMSRVDCVGPDWLIEIWLCIDVYLAIGQRHLSFWCGLRCTWK